MTPLRIQGLCYDPYAFRDKQAESPYLVLLTSGRWRAVSKRRYYAIDRALTLRGVP